MNAEQLATLTHERVEQTPDFTKIRRVASTLNQLLTMNHIFGPVNTVKMVKDRLIDQVSDKEMQIQPRPLNYPLQVRRIDSDRWNVLEIFRDRSYALPSEIKRRTKGNAIVDIGAYIGVSAAYFASEHADSPVYAIEPNPSNAEILARNAARYSGQIAVTEAALLPVKASVTKQEFTLSQKNLMANAYTSAEEGSLEIPEPSVKVVTPDEILEKIGGTAIGILKVDIEGAERELFSSDTIDPLLAETNILLVETHDRFIAGSSAAVANAADRNGLYPSYLNNHTAMYSRNL